MLTQIMNRSRYPPRTPTRLDFPDDDSEGTPNNAVVLNELANQVGQLSAGMQQMQDGMRRLELEVARRDPSSERPSHVHSRNVNKHKPEVTAAELLAGAAKDDAFVCLPSGAKVSHKILKTARNREFINLSDFAPCLEPSIITETSLVDGELQFKPKRTLKNIDSFLLWSMAWRGYEEVMVEADHSRYAQLVEYRIFIQTCAARYWWNAVYSYDVRNRAKKSMTRSLDFHVMDNDIYMTSMDTSTTRTNIRQCNRCRSIWHVVRDCPFPEEVAVATNTRSPQVGARSSQDVRMSQSSSSNYTRRIGMQACFNWNAGRCFANPCTRLHVCERCGGPDPLPRCRNCNPSSASGAGNQNPGNSGNQYHGNTGHQLSGAASTFTPASGGGYPSQAGRLG
jgi:X-X-X-Leu-X-X-Gly heptad repeat protein